MSASNDALSRAKNEVDSGEVITPGELSSLSAYLTENGLADGPVRAAAIGDGHSNITLSITGSGADLVLRRPPRGPLPPSAHDMVREARILQGLRHTDVVIPAVLAVCEDPAVIGVPFYLMERVAGHVVADTVPAELDSIQDRRRMGSELVDGLVRIHAVDWQSAGLAGIGRPSGYLERQLRRFSGLWEHNRTRDVAAIGEIAQWLESARPTERDVSVVHGDYRLGNVMFGPVGPPTLVAVFDWEMATIGDPLADVGYMSMLWVDADDPPLGGFEIYRVTREPGFYSRSELLEQYANRSGRDLCDIAWYQVLALWKSAIFMEGNYKRAISGLTDDPFLKSFTDGVHELSDRALRIIAEMGRR
jgi:aminoglycoside phosphotransferase (APT) family kinase protein